MSSWLLIPKINHTYIWFEPCVCIRLKNDWTRALCVKIRFVLMIGKWLRFCSRCDNASALSFLPLVHLKASLPPCCHRHRHHHHEKRWKLFFLIVPNLLNKQCRVHICIWVSVFASVHVRFLVFLWLCLSPYVFCLVCGASYNWVNTI